MAINDFIANLRSSEISEADRISNLMEIEKEYNTQIAELEKAKQELEFANNEVSKYAKLNNELFLASSKSLKEIETTQINKNINIDDNPPPKRKFEDLKFN